MPKTMGLLGKKIGMVRTYDQEGRASSATALELGPCIVLQKKTVETDGYNALQLGFSSKKESRMNKAEIGHASAASKGGFYHIKEFRVDDPGLYEVGQAIAVGEMFKIGQIVDVCGTVKGRGFQGVMKRHGFKGGGKTHGSMFHRAPGSIGCSAWPSRVVKGKKMPGRMGNNTVTKKNVIVIDIRVEDNVMVVKGPVPGAKQGLLQIFGK